MGRPRGPGGSRLLVEYERVRAKARMPMQAMRKAEYRLIIALIRSSLLGEHYKRRCHLAVRTRSILRKSEDPS